MIVTRFMLLFKLFTWVAPLQEVDDKIFKIFPITHRHVLGFSAWGLFHGTRCRFLNGNRYIS